MLADAALLRADCLALARLWFAPPAKRRDAVRTCLPSVRVRQSSSTLALAEGGRRAQRPKPFVADGRRRESPLAISRLCSPIRVEAAGLAAAHLGVRQNEAQHERAGGCRRPKGAALVPLFASLEFARLLALVLGATKLALRQRKPLSTRASREAAQLRISALAVRRAT